MIFLSIKESFLEVIPSEAVEYTNKLTDNCWLSVQILTTGANNQNKKFEKLTTTIHIPYEILSHGGTPTFNLKASSNIWTKFQISPLRWKSKIFTAGEFVSRNVFKMQNKNTKYKNKQIDHELLTQCPNSHRGDIRQRKNNMILEPLRHRKSN